MDMEKDYLDTIKRLQAAFDQKYEAMYDSII